MMSDFKKWQYSAEKQTTMDDAIKVELECFIVCRARPMNPLKCSWNRNALNSRTSKASQPSYDSCVAWCRAGLSGNPPAESLHACSLSWTESFVSLSFFGLEGGNLAAHGHPFAHRALRHKLKAPWRIVFSLRPSFFKPATTSWKVWVTIDCRRPLSCAHEKHRCNGVLP